ncbi:MAG: hypothetical protein IT276_01030 [Ignavibacteriaceae bacterium]|nr:hypothetical protein [Ignavibacteriaceae bacterium]HRN26740.1 hypothetical protein [Ignavibacteriaceae bacterium]HRQ54808.1 hypothetical protein [Ignavibacteriaceae bacterium]
MKTIQNITVKVFSLTAVLLLVSPVLIINQSAAQTNTDFKVLDIQTEIGEGKDKEAKVLFDGERRKIAQLTLRNEMSLKPHSVEEPITVQCVAGSGDLIIGEGENSELIKLQPGVFVTIDANVLHDIIGKPSVSIVLIRFLEEYNK